MQLGKLRAAIRAHRGTVNVEVELGGRVLSIPAQKAGLLNDVLTQFAEEMTDETGLRFEHGLLWRPTDGLAPTAPVVDLLLGDDDPAVEVEEEAEFEDLFA